jgi:dTDP-4-amino-4,6-dideoxygalactose transaminase
MEVLSERVSQRRAVYNWYTRELAGTPGISFVNEPPTYFSNRWLSTILVDPDKSGLTRETLRLAFETDNIESRPLWKPMHMQPVFADCPYYGDGTAEKLFANGLCLPSGSNLTDADMDRIKAILQECFATQTI